MATWGHDQNSLVGRNQSSNRVHNRLGVAATRQSFDSETVSSYGARHHSSLMNVGIGNDERVTRARTGLMGLSVVFKPSQGAKKRCFVLLYVSVQLD